MPSKSWSDYGLILDRPIKIVEKCFLRKFKKLKKMRKQLHKKFLMIDASNGYA